MPSNLTKDLMIDIIKNEININPREARIILEILLEEIKIALENQEEVKISGFGKWVVRKKKKRIGRNPHTGQSMDISARKVLVFLTSEKFRNKINE